MSLHTYNYAILFVCIANPLRVSIASEKVSEADGVVENFVTVVREVQAEIPIDFSVSVTGGSATKGIYMYITI